MAFTRKFLTDNGVPEDKIDTIMAERNRTLTDYIPKADVQAQIDAAVAAAPPAGNVTDSDEYKALVAKLTKTEAIHSDDFKAVKQPYLDMVWDKLDHNEKHKPYGEQLQGLAEAMPDIFMQKEEPVKPQFGAPVQGQMPTGDAGKSFMDSWGFVPKK